VLDLTDRTNQIHTLSRQFRKHLHEFIFVRSVKSGTKNYNQNIDAWLNRSDNSEIRILPNKPKSNTLIFFFQIQEQNSNLSAHIKHQPSSLAFSCLFYLKQQSIPCVLTTSHWYVTRAGKQMPTKNVAFCLFCSGLNAFLFYWILVFHWSLKTQFWVHLQLMVFFIL
jgi:hypothetical protein